MKESMDRNDKVFERLLEEGFDKYAKNAADYEPEVEMTEEDIRIMDSKKDNIYNNIMKEINRYKKKNLPFKLVIPLVAVLILVLAYSTNTFAFRTFLHQTFMSLTGTDLNFNTKKLAFEDYDNIVNFENKDEIIVPGWLPEGMKLKKITDGNNFIDFFFESDELYWVALKTKSISDGDNTNVETENNQYKVKIEKILSMDCKIVEIKSEVGLKTYIVHWNSDNLNYSLMTNIPENDFNKLLKNLQYLEE